MQILVTADQMREVENAAVRKYGIPSLLLMENAGRAFADYLEDRLDSIAEQRVVVLCGKGNNGGDGFVIARHLASRGGEVSVLLLGKRKDVRGDARTNLRILLKLAENRKSRVHFREIPSVKSLKGIAKPGIIVDALLGTGFRGPMKKVFEGAVDWINRSGALVFSVDVPSGVDATNGDVPAEAVNANGTLTMGLGKIGLYLGDGREHAGEVVVADIGLPTVVLGMLRHPVIRVEEQDVTTSLPQRSLRAHKHSVGKVFVLGGSRNLTGAPFLAAQAAMRIGSGSVVLGVPKSIHFLLARKLTEAMVHPLKETPGGSVSPQAIDGILTQCEWADAVVIGPGLSRDLETQDLLVNLLPRIRKPLVLDADGLAVLAGNPSLTKSRKAATILTPHVGELSRIVEKKGTLIEQERVMSCRAAAVLFKSITVLKGSPTAIGCPDGRVFLNPTGNPGMATAGSGDVLSGMIGGLVAQSIPPQVAAYAGVYLHGLAGDLAERKLGQRGMLALDICDRIPEALQSVGG